MNKVKHIVGALAIVGAAVNMTSCMNNNSNPFYSEYDTPHQTVPFDEIKLEHYEPAFMEGIKQHSAEVEAIIKIMGEMR